MAAGTRSVTWQAVPAPIACVPPLPRSAFCVQVLGRLNAPGAANLLQCGLLQRRRGTGGAHIVVPLHHLHDLRRVSRRCLPISAAQRCQHTLQAKNPGAPTTPAPGTLRPPV